MEKEKKTNLLHNIRYLIKKTMEFDCKVIYECMLYAFMIAMIPLLTSFFSKYITDELIGKRKELIICSLIVFFLIGLFTKGISPYLKSLYEPRIMGVREKFINLLNKKVMDMNYEYTESSEIGTKLDLAMRAVSDNMSGIEGMLNCLVIMVGNSLSIIVYSVFIFLYKWWIFVWLIFFLCIQTFFELKKERYEIDRAKEIAACSRKKDYLYYVMGDFRNGKEIRLNELSSYFSEKFEEAGGELLEIQKDIFEYKGKCQSLEYVIKGVEMIMVYFTLFYSYRIGEITVGQFSFYFSAISIYKILLGQFMNSIIEMQKQSYFIDDYCDFLALKEYYSLSVDNSIEINEINEIEIEHLYFAYPNSEKYVLNDVSLKISKGERIALVGLNGAGKTTLIKILCGFYQPTLGVIKINGIDISRINKKSYVNQISALFQDYNFFAFSIKDNIVGGVEVDEARVDQIINQLNLRALFNELKNGIDTTLYRILDKDGVEFSGGQNQRIAFARALYKRNSLILLDEPTAALDVVTETELYEDFNDLTEGKMVIFISHRLASTKFCDRIITIYEGRIDEVGSHDELIAKNGRYAELFRLQRCKYFT